MKRAGSRLVYSTDDGRVCATCGRPTGECRCGAPEAADIPARIVVRLRLETAGRRGKAVTVVDGLPRNEAFLAELASELKRACGAGGGAGEGRVEVQGDHRERLRQLLEQKGWAVRG